MKTKNLNIFAVCSVALILLLVLVSAAATFTSTNPEDFTKNETIQTFVIENTDTGGTDLEIDFTDTVFTDENGETVTISFNQTGTTLTILPDESAMVQAEISDISEDFLYGEHSLAYTLTDNINGTEEELTLNFVNSFCSDGSIGYEDLEISRFKIENNGEDDEIWRPLDTVQIEVRFENDGQDLDDVIIELGLFEDGSNTNIAGDLDWISSDEEEYGAGNVDEDEQVTHTFEFFMDPAEIDVDISNYILAVKAYPEGEEDTACVDFAEGLGEFGDSEYFADIEIEFQDDDEQMVIVDDSKFTVPIAAQCGDMVTLMADVWNVGNDDEIALDKTKVTLFNSELGLNLEEFVNGDLDIGEKEGVTFSFEVPKGITEKTYNLIMETFYDYDEDDDTYGESSEDTFTAQLKVEGNCEIVGQATVTANLETETVTAGGQAIVRATITNPGSETAEYVLNAAGYTTWADAVTLDSTEFSLGTGASREVVITIDVQEGISGSQRFNLEIVSGNQLVMTQPISVMVENPGFLSKITGNAISGGNSTFWIVGAVNLVLILGIIFVAIRLLRR